MYIGCAIGQRPLGLLNKKTQLCEHNLTSILITQSTPKIWLTRNRTGGH